MLFGVVCNLLNLCVTVVTCLCFSLYYMPHHKTETSKSSGYVCHVLSSMCGQLLSWPLHPGYWMSHSTNHCPLWQLARATNATHQWHLGPSLGHMCWAAKPTIAFKLLDVMHGEHLLYNGASCHHVHISCGWLGYKGYQAICICMYHGIHLWGSHRGMGHASTRMCLGWHHCSCCGGDEAQGQQHNASLAMSRGCSCIVSGDHWASHVAIWMGHTGISLWYHPKAWGTLPWGYALGGIVVAAVTVM